MTARPHWQARLSRITSHGHGIVFRWPGDESVPAGRPGATGSPEGLSGRLTCDNLIRFRVHLLAAC